MKTTGIVRKIDELGRIVLPKELRKCLNINTGDDFQIRVEDEKIILEKYSYLKNYEQEILKIINCFISETTYVSDIKQFIIFIFFSSYTLKIIKLLIKN